MDWPFLDSPCNDPDFCVKLLRKLPAALPAGGMRFMEVCGTHTVSLFRSGLRSLLPAGVVHISGPGCPVCVTHEEDVAAFLELAARENVILATFGDLMRVPGPRGNTLKRAKANGADVRVIYSPLDAVDLALRHPRRHVVFPAIGFETTAPLAAAAVLTARRLGISNFYILPLNKLVPPALEKILGGNDCGLDALLLPGHVCTITGPGPFEPIAAKYSIPCVISGFEAADLALALCILASQLGGGKPRVVNAYPRAVANGGNPKARMVTDTVFAISDAKWRGLGAVPHSGLALRPEFCAFDARRRFRLEPVTLEPTAGCRCGDVLCGRIQPVECLLFGRSCTPASPVGPCMVASEGSCAAYFKYGVR